MPQPPEAPRVLLVLPRLDVGGMEQAVLAQARLLRHRRIDLRLATLAPGGPLMARAVADGLPVTAATGMLHLRSAVAFLGQVVRQTGARLLHSHTGTWLPAAIVARRLRLPHIHTRHGFVPGRVATASEFLATRGTDHLVCVSAELLQHARRLLRVAPDRSELLPNGVDLEALPEPRQVTAEAPPAVVMVCRLAAIKNVAVVLEAVQRARRQVPALTLTLIGDGPERAPLHERAVALGVADAVRFLGMQDAPWSHLPPGAVFVQASASEGLSLSLIEAMAMGCRVVATDVGQTAAFTAGAAGVRLVAPGAVEPIADALIAMGAMPPAEARQLEAANRRHARAVGGLEPVVHRLASLYAGLGASGGARH